jgi:lysophospholipase L1-like esterase
MSTNNHSGENTVSRIVLFGGSSLATTYVPDEHTHRTLLEQGLRAVYPEQNIEVVNNAYNGELVARYLIKGTYERDRALLKGADIAVLRFGANDQKRIHVEEFRDHMTKFVQLLRQDFPGLHIVFQTLIYLDYPEHMYYDRNQELEPFSQVSRDLAREFGYSLSDFFEVGKRETAKGNWDYRIRRNKDGIILDNSQDAGNESPRWFSDIHPNLAGIRMAVEEDIRVLKERFPAQLPTGQKAVSRPAKSAEEYEQLLNFPADRLNILLHPNQEQILQQ